MKTLVRALFILVLSVSLGFGLYSVATPLGPASPSCQAGSFHGKPAYAGQADGAGAHGHGTEGGSAGLASLVPVLGEFGAAFLGAVALMAALGKLGPGRAKGKAAGSALDQARS